MFGVSGGELVLLLLIGLVVLGPERLPRVANKIGSWLGQARRMTRMMKRQLEDELDLNQNLQISPPKREPSTQPVYTPPRDDDDYSPAHEPEAPGTGIDEPDAADMYDDESDLAVTEQDRADAAATEVPEGEDAAVEKTKAAGGEAKQ